MSDKNSMILIVEPFDSKRKNQIACKRDHHSFLNLKIKGSTERFCTHIMVETMEMSEGTIKVKMCGDVPI